jgi:hypothetical protein
MARLAGRNGSLYMNLTSGGTAEPVAFLTQWTLDQATPRTNVAAFGDTTQVYVGGLPDAQGTYSGWYDDATAQFYTAALDGIARKVYLYPDRTTSTKYFFGTAFFDMSVDISVDGAAAISGSWSAASAIAKVG